MKRVRQAESYSLCSTCMPNLLKKDCEPLRSGARLPRLCCVLSLRNPRMLARTRGPPRPPTQTRTDYDSSEEAPRGHRRGTGTVQLEYTLG